MINSNNYDDTNQFSPMTSIMLDDLLNSPNPIELQNIDITPYDLNSPNNTRLSSPTQLIASVDNESMDTFENTMDNNNFGYCVRDIDPPFNVLDSYSTEVRLNEYQNEKLQIIAQPKAIYRLRYASEIAKDKQRANRFIRTEDGDDQHEYPTIKIPSWCNPNQQLYIRVTLVTVTSDRIPYHCIHPYAIDTPDENVNRDEPNNSIFFRINENEFNTREKYFNIIISKKKQDELKSYGPMRLFDQKPYENITIENPQDPKQKIAIYQLFKAQFVFTIAQRQANNSDFVLLLHTSVKSRIMTAENVIKKNSSTDRLNDTFNNIIRCIPQKGGWEGGDEIAINMPNPIKEKEYTIYFDFGQYGRQYINHIIRIDRKTILIQTPLCPIPSGDEYIKVSIVIQDNKSIIYQTEFYYIPSMKTTDNISSDWQRNDINIPKINERRWTNLNGRIEEDNEQRKNIQPMDNYHLRAILLKLQDRLSDDDRKRLHFFIGDDVPARIRDDPSLGGTLHLLESLFEQDIINEQDFTFLIDAFDEIQCIDAVKLLREHIKQIQSNELNQSVQNLSVLMPSLEDQVFEDQVFEDQNHKYPIHSCLMEQRNIFDNNNPVIVDVSNQRKALKRKQRLCQSSMTLKCFLLFVSLSIILVGALIGCSICIIHLKIKYNILNEHTNHNETVEYIRQSQARNDRMIESFAKNMKSMVIQEIHKIQKLCPKKPYSTSKETTTSMAVDLSPRVLEDLACLEACYKCVEGFQTDYKNEMTANNCGPMCECANRCGSSMPIQEIDRIYSQSNFTRSDKNCFWRTYIQSLHNEVPLLL